MAKKKSLSLKRHQVYAAFFIGVIFVAYFLAIPVFSEASTINVNLTINTSTPFCGDGTCNNGENCSSCSNDCGSCPPPPPIDNPPNISGITSTSTLTTGTVTWNATDDHAISSCSLAYGVTTGYGSSALVTGSYTASLTSLTQGTIYYYQISATDNAGQTVYQTGQFSTLAADLIAPNISNITVATTSNSANLSWNTNENADAQIQYGVTSAYGSTVSNASFLTSQTLAINTLMPVTTYHYRIIATDASGNATTTLDRTFITAPDAVPPADVSNLNISATTSTISLTWTNPNDTDFLNVRVVRKAGSAPTSPSDGSLLYTGTNTSYSDTTAAVQTIYYYMVYSYDTSGNRSGGTFVSGERATPPNEICNNNIDDNFNGLVDCADAACNNAPVCAPPQNEICNNGIDDNLNGFTDCADAACVNSPVCAAPAVENCTNGLDDDSNGLVDCADSACSTNQSCLRPGGGGGGTVTNPEICSNGIDDNLNGFTDCADSACLGYPGCRLVVPTSTPATTTAPTATTTEPVVTVSEPERLKSTDLQFLTGNRRIEVVQRNGVVTGLAGVDFTIGIPANKLPSVPVSAVISFAGENHAFGPDSNQENYYADFVFPQIGEHRATIEIDYGAGQKDGVNVTLRSLSLGQVVAADKPLGDVAVTLFRAPNTTFEAGSYGLDNPQTTEVNGTFGWVVPNGKYYLTASREGYFTRKTPVFEIFNNVVNSRITLIQLPPKLDLNPQNIAKILEVTTQVGIQKISDTLIEAKDLAADPQVQETVTTVVAPTVVGVVAVGTITAVSWANLIPLLQLLFLQPLVFFGSRKKREAWGQVYNSLDKMPVDLAAVRLISEENGKVVQSKVTDNQGRYAFVVNPGAYRIEVIKNNFVFPSELLAESKDDGKKIDIYHGEIINVTEKDALITANIPLDPVGEHEKPARLRWRRAIHSIQIFIWWVGLVINGIALYISPRWYLWIFLVLQFVLFALLKIMATPPKIKSWGIVYDITNKQPVGRVIARLFNVKFNKLVSSQVTDGKGRYYFLAGDDEYYITYEHPEYAGQKTSTIDLKGRPSETINVDVGLRPSDIPEEKPDKEDEAPKTFKKL